jgi:hypothetical protein
MMSILPNLVISLIMKLEPQETKKNFVKDQKTFDQLPVKTKELQILKDQAEKSTGQENVDLNEVIREKSK